MDNQQQTAWPVWQWKDVPDRQRWIAAWGVLWRIWVLSLGVYAAILVVVLLVAFTAAILSN
jgi:hypothetical protein